MDAWTAFGTALGLTLLAEFGDKTQFAVLALASRGRPVRVWVGAAAAFFLLSLVGAWAGAAVGDRIPLRWVATGAGVVFIVLGVLGLRRRDEDEPDKTRSQPGVMAAFLLVALAEFGDRSQLAVVALAAREGHPWAIGLGAGTGMALATVGSVLVAHVLRGRLPERALRLVGAVVFILVGVAFVAFAWL